MRGGAVHGVLHEQAAARAAALAVVEEEADVGGHDGLVKVSVFEHDEGRLAAELESDLQGCVTAGKAREFEEGGRGCTFFRLDCAAYSWILLPTAVEPVNATLLIVMRGLRFCC